MLQNILWTASKPTLIGYQEKIKSFWEVIFFGRVPFPEIEQDQYNEMIE